MIQSQHVANVPMGQKTVVAERRRYLWLRGMVAWFLDSDADTLEKVCLVLQGLTAIGVLLFSSRLIATPPPWWHGFILVLPSQLWAALLVVGIFCQLRARHQLNWHARHAGAVYSLAVCSVLCGPLWLRAPGFCLVLAGVVCFQAVLAGHVAHNRKQAK